MPAQVFLHRRAGRELQRLPKPTARAVREGLELLKSQPLAGIRLKGELSGKRKLRIGDWRIIYEFFPKERTVVVYKIESRQKVYK